MSKIVLIDDDARLLDGLHAAVADRLPDVSIAKWRPGSEDDVAVAFREYVDDGETVLVATDQDLTAGGLRGFFGATIVRWCQQLLIPVGDFSRRTPQLLPRDADLFELRIPPDDKDGADYIEATYYGFTALAAAISELDLDPGTTSLAKYLAHAVQRPHLESDFALYMARLGTAERPLPDESSAADPPRRQVAGRRQPRSATRSATTSQT